MRTLLVSKEKYTMPWHRETWPSKHMRNRYKENVICWLWGN